MIEIRIVQLARQLGVHRNTISNWIKNGKLKAKPTFGKRYLIEESEWHRFCGEARVSRQVIAPQIAADNPNRSVTTEILTHHPPIQSEVHMTGNPIGSVMVVGGGIAGIQASLDLANSGYFVHLVERSAGIGGGMAQLDKTFPTNDCAM